METIGAIAGIVLIVLALFVGKADKSKGEIIAPPRRMAADMGASVYGLTIIAGFFALLINYPGVAIFGMFAIVLAGCGLYAKYNLGANRRQNRS